MHWSCAVVVVLACVFSGVLSALPLPDFIKPCARSDPKFNECAKKHAKEALASPVFAKGDRRYKLPPLSPFDIKEIKVTQGEGLTFTMKDVKFHGLLNFDIEEMDFDFEKKHCKFTFNFPRFTQLGKYEIDGKIQLLPIKGNGDINITTVNQRITYEFDYTLEPIEGKLHLKSKNTKSKTSVLSRIYVHLTNLFNGNEILGAEMNQFLNDNWKELDKEFSPTFKETLVQIANTLMNGIASTVPFDEVFPETLP